MRLDVFLFLSKALSTLPSLLSPFISIIISINLFTAGISTITGSVIFTTIESTSLTSIAILRVTPQFNLHEKSYLSNLKLWGISNLYHAAMFNNIECSNKTELIKLNFANKFHYFLRFQSRFLLRLLCVSLLLLIFCIQFVSVSTRN